MDIADDMCRFTIVLPQDVGFLLYNTICSLHVKGYFCEFLSLPHCILRMLLSVKTIFLTHKVAVM